MTRDNDANHLIRSTTATAILVNGYWRKESVSVRGILHLKATSNGMVSSDAMQKWIIFADNYPVLQDTNNLLRDAKDYGLKRQAYEVELLTALGLQQDGYDASDVALWEVKIDNDYGVFIKPDNEYYETYCNSYGIDPTEQVSFVRCVATSHERKAFVIEDWIETRRAKVEENGEYRVLIGRGDKMAAQEGRVNLKLEGE